MSAFGAGAGGHFDADGVPFALQEERVRARTGHDDPIAAHALADQVGLDPGRELTAITTPALGQGESDRKHLARVS